MITKTYLLMNRNILFLLTTFIILLSIGCGSNTEGNKNNQSATVSESPSTDKGIGKFKSVELTHPLDQAMIAKAQAIYSAKCFACHKLTNEKLVGPGWKGVTDKKTPEWIMNFITNTNVMLDSNLVAQQLLVTCVTRMPSQNLTDDEARDMLEFMRKNDGKN